MISTGFLFGVSLFFIVFLAFWLVVLFFAFANMVNQKNTFKKLYIQMLKENCNLSIGNSNRFYDIGMYKHALNLLNQNLIDKCIFINLEHFIAKNGVIQINNAHENIQEARKENEASYTKILEKKLAAIDETANLGAR